MTGNEPRIMSIAPSFNCMLKCEGCYLTTDVTKEMREATKPDYYWERAMKLGVRYGYTELAMTLNPFPGAIEHTRKLAIMAKQVGFKTVNVTMSWRNMDWDKEFIELLRYVDVITESVDENRKAKATSLMLNSYLEGDKNWSEQAANTHVNLNILWSPKLMQQFVDKKGGAYRHITNELGAYEHLNNDSSVFTGDFTVQHLILKPLSLYGDFEFEEAYQKIMEDVPLGGDGNLHIGDVAFGNLLGLNDCPGKRMIDIDPMGFVRRCPENPNAYDATDLFKLEQYMKDGIPGCGDACDCITG
jgi:MoaA/NifB/PqqE/SkfB family radical SAM enzyme